jgi:predicted transcriptional regulator
VIQRNTREQNHINELESKMREIQAELDMPAEEFERKLLAKLRAEVDLKRKKLEVELHVEVQQTKAHLIL